MQRNLLVHNDLESLEANNERLKVRISLMNYGVALIKDIVNVLQATSLLPHYRGLILIDDTFKGRVEDDGVRSVRNTIMKITSNKVDIQPHISKLDDLSELLWRGRVVYVDFNRVMNNDLGTLSRLEAVFELGKSV